MTSDPKNSKRFISSLASAFQKHSVWKKSKNSLFRSIFKYDLRGLKWPETKTIPQRLLLTIPHHPSCSSITIPHHPSQSRWGMVIEEHEGWWGMVKRSLWGIVLVSGHFSPRRSYVKINLKSENFDFFQTLCFWKAESKLGMYLLEFLGSEVIRGRERSSKVKFENLQNLSCYSFF